MKALDEYFLMVVFMLLLNVVHVFANFMFKLFEQRNRNIFNETLFYADSIKAWHSWEE